MTAFIGKMRPGDKVVHENGSAVGVVESVEREGVVVKWPLSPTPILMNLYSIRRVPQ